MPAVGRPWPSDDDDDDDDVRQVLVVVDGPMVHYHGKGVRHYVLTLMHIVSPCDHQSSSWFWGDHGDHDELVLTYRHHVLTQTQMQMSHDQKMQWSKSTSNDHCNDHPHAGFTDLPWRFLGQPCSHLCRQTAHTEGDDDQNRPNLISVGQCGALHYITLH